MARQFALWAAVLLMIGVVAAAVAPTADEPAPPAFPAPRPPGVPAGRVVEATLPAPDPVVADPGDVVRLRIESAVPDRAEIAGLGISAPVGPGSEGIVELVADVAGRWDVRLDEAGTRVGVLEVTG